MIILTAAALAAAQPAPAQQTPAPAAQPAGQHAGHAGHGQMQHGQTCPCCAQGGSTRDRDCCAEHRQQQHRGHDDHR